MTLFEIFKIGQSNCCQVVVSVEDKKYLRYRGTTFKTGANVVVQHSLTVCHC